MTIYSYLIISRNIYFISFPLGFVYEWFSSTNTNMPEYNNVRGKEEKSLLEKFTWKLFCGDIKEWRTTSSYIAKSDQHFILFSLSAIHKNYISSQNQLTLSNKIFLFNKYVLSYFFTISVKGFHPVINFDIPETLNSPLRPSIPYKSGIIKLWS